MRITKKLNYSNWLFYNWTLYSMENKVCYTLFVSDYSVINYNKHSFYKLVEIYFSILIVRSFRIFDVFSLPLFFIII